MVDRLLTSEANLQRIAAVERAFGWLGIPLVVPGRVLIGEGTLTKICRKAPKPRKFFLFNDILVYGNVLLERKRYTKQRVLPLEHIMVESMPDTDEYQNCLIIRTVRKSFVVKAESRNVKRQWLMHMRRCITNILRKTGKDPPTRFAAVMLPNAAVRYCMNCRCRKFTFFERRHHCHKCGKVVCAACSSNKYLLPLQSSKPLRVCNRCYVALKHESRPIGARQLQNVSTISVSSSSSYESASSAEYMEPLPAVAARAKAMMSPKSKSFHLPRFSRAENVSDEVCKVETVTTYFYRAAMQES